MLHFRWPFALAAVSITLGSPAAAQTLRGRILDSQSGEPVMLAYVGLLAEGRDLVVAALAGRTGEFALRAPAAGAYFVYVSRSGYETLMDGVFELGADGVFDVQIGLKPSPIPLEALLVESDRDVSPLEAVGFYERATMGFGHFLIREEIERVAIDRISDALRNIPQLQVDASRPLLGPEVFRPPRLLIRRAGQPCSPTLYVDGAVVAFGGQADVRPDEYVNPSDVEAIEVYTRPSDTPVQFDAINDCGVVVVWTRVR